jgi:uncharacterized protein YbjT (DUF2867 family)
LKPLQIAILGGSGFVGQHLLLILHGRGHGLRVLSRRPERHRVLKLLPGLEVWPVDVHDEAALTDALGDCQVAINLVGILGKPFSRDNLRSAQVANVCETNALETVFGLAPRRVEAQLPPYLGHPKSWAKRRRLT